MTRSFVSAVLLATMLAGCSRADRETARGDASRAADAVSTAAAAYATAGPVLAGKDALATAAIKTRMAAVDADSARTVDVSVKDGAATLSGRIRRGERIAPLIAIARGTLGVASVRSTIVVDPTLPSLGAAASDAALAASIRAALLAQVGLNAFSPTLAVRRGVATVGGRVRSSAMRQIVVSTVRGVRGVRVVVDRMTVAQ